MHKSTNGHHSPDRSFNSAFAALGITEETPKTSANTQKQNQVLKPATPVNSSQQNSNSQHFHDRNPNIAKEISETPKTSANTQQANQATKPAAAAITKLRIIIPEVVALFTPPSSSKNKMWFCALPTNTKRIWNSARTTSNQSEKLSATKRKGNDISKATANELEESQAKRPRFYAPDTPATPAAQNGPTNYTF